MLPKPKYYVYLDHEGVLIVEDAGTRKHETVFETEWGYEVRVNNESGFAIMWSGGQHGGARLIVVFMAVDAGGMVVLDTMTETMQEAVTYLTLILNVNPITWYTWLKEA